MAKIIKRKALAVIILEKANVWILLERGIKLKRGLPLLLFEMPVFNMAHVSEK